MDWVTPLRETHNVPLWMGESGENSNTWYTNFISLLEKKDIGWAWWTIKKVGDIDSPFSVKLNSIPSKTVTAVLLSELVLQFPNGLLLLFANALLKLASLLFLHLELKVLNLQKLWSKFATLQFLEFQFEAIQTL